MSNSNKPKKDAIEKLIASKKAHGRQITPILLFERIKKGDKGGLSEGITLLESQKPEDREKAHELLEMALPLAGNSIRIGITGVPGVGKSTFIESFGKHLVDDGNKVAVLAIDPSSEKSGGSILGDKTRMIELSNNPNAYIRPSATAGSLGGVARKTRESILLCEAAGFNVILIETVGVGQSEIAVHSMTDFFLLLMLAGAGDELQGIKRGIMEMADTILITKADGDNTKKANLARSEYKNAIHLFPANKNDWIPKVETISSLEKKGIEKVWEIIGSFQNLVKTNGHLNLKRKEQQEYWMNEALKEELMLSFYETAGIKSKIAEITEQLNKGLITSYQASEQIMKFYNERKKNF
jgi:LAO/AO transport system kinase